MNYGPSTRKKTRLAEGMSVSGEVALVAMSDQVMRLVEVCMQLGETPPITLKGSLVPLYR